MPYAHFQIPVQGGDEETSLNQFIHQHRVVKTEKRFIECGLESFWAYQIQYEGKAAQAPSGQVKKGKKGAQIDYKDVLSEEDFILYVKLKEWRKQRANELDVELYAIFTNAQLAEIAEKKCQKLKDVKAIAGVGETRIENHSEALLEFVKSLS